MNLCNLYILVHADIFRENFTVWIFHQKYYLKEKIKNFPLCTWKVYSYYWPPWDKFLIMFITKLSEQDHQQSFTVHKPRQYSKQTVFCIHAIFRFCSSGNVDPEIVTTSRISTFGNKFRKQSRWNMTTCFTDDAEYDVCWSKVFKYCSIDFIHFMREIKKKKRRYNSFFPTLKNK